MSTLLEIETAADALPVKQKQELIMFLVQRLRAQGGRLPEPRQLAPEQIGAWIGEDEADLTALSDNKQHSPRA